MPEKNFVSAGDIKPGQVFKARDGKLWIVLEQWESATKVLMKSGLGRSIWRERNNNYAAPIIEHGYNGSDVDILCKKA